MLCIFHSVDLDGHCSAAIVKAKHPEAKLYGWTYGEEVPWSMIEDRLAKDEELFVVDVTLPGLAEYDEFFARYQSQIIWIDHHVTNVEKERKTNRKDHFRGWRVADGSAACELTWEYLFTSHRIPEAVRLLGRYDVWDHNYDAAVLPFQMAMRSKETNPESPISEGVWMLWNSFIDPCQEIDQIMDVVEEGDTILKYQDKQDKEDAEKFGFIGNFEDMRVFAINRRRANSKPFRDEANFYEAEAVMAFVRHPDNQWIVSLYDTDYTGQFVNLGEIAERYGGGGHKGAAGFESAGCPFPTFEDAVK